MPWGGWTRKPAIVAPAAVGVDLNAGRVRAVGGPSTVTGFRPLPLGGETSHLPLMLNLEQRAPTVGWAAYRISRLLPHLVCRDFLPDIGTAREWRGPNRRFSALDAVSATAGHLRTLMPPGHAAGLVLPPYLADQQVVKLSTASENAGLHVAGSMTVPLALAAADTAPFGTALVLDIDEHALTWSVLAAEGPHARQLATHSLPGAGVRAWMDRLIDGISDRCVKICRRDPRDSASAEQGLLEQLDALLTGAAIGPSFVLQIRTAHWFQELKLSVEDLEALTAPLARAAVEGMRQVLAEAHAAAPVMARPDLLWVTADASRWPGLIAAATQHVPESTVVRTLHADALASAGFVLADRWLRGELARGHYAGAAPRFAIPTAAAHDLNRGRSRRV